MQNLQKILTFRVSERARLMRLKVTVEGQVIVTVPQCTSQILVDNFVHEKSPWIERTLHHFELAKDKVRLCCDNKKFHEYKEHALALAQQRVAYFNQYYGFTVGKIAIRNQKSRWGSCSRQGNLSFSYCIALLPAELADYVIVHELCHLKEFNHSARFWKLVAHTVPNYQELKNRFL